MSSNLPTRTSLYYQLSSDLAHFDNEQLKTLVYSDADPTHGWGVNRIIAIGKSKVFVKTVRVTELEFTHLFSTKNLYDLPTYYNYGVGSAGFGVWRELVTHIKTTNWVLSGACENFPLMYHYRVVPRDHTDGDSLMNTEQHEQYVTYWNSNENIGKYMLDRRDAKYELVLLLEHFPYVLDAWLGKNTARLEPFILELRDTVTFLRKNGIIHFDVHSGNIVTDGERPYLTDFGLVLDKRFDLSESERTFFKNNTHYDYGELLTCLGWLFRSVFDRLSETKKQKAMKKYGVGAETPVRQRYITLLKNIQGLYEDGLLKSEKSLVDAVLKYREIILLMLKFYSDMRQNNQKNTKFQHAKLRRLLEETEFL